MTAHRSIAAAQTVPLPGDVAGNLQQHLLLVRVAAEQQAQVVVFPELSLTGYELELGSALAFSEDDPRLAPLVDAASSHSLTVVAGAPVRIRSQLHIGAFIVSPDGTVAVYTKHRLGAFSDSARVDGVVPPPEREFFQPGIEDPPVIVGGTTAAVAVCADVGRASHPQQAAARGARTYLASMFVIPSEIDGEIARLQGYAVTHRLAIAMANFGGPSGGLASAGRSAIWSERGALLAQLDACGAGIVTAVETDAGWQASTVMLASR